MLIGYTRVSTERQDLASQRAELRRLGVEDERVYTDKRTGKNKDRPGLREALAAVREGDTLVVAKMDRLARSVPDARDIVQDLYERGARLQIGSSVHDPNDPVGKFLFNALAMVAEFEHDLIVQRTKEGLAIAKANGRLRGTKPKLSDRRQKTQGRLRERRLHPRGVSRGLPGFPSHGLQDLEAARKPSMS